MHTHPGDSAIPSSTDEETFSRCFGSSDWAIMFILAQGGETYARLALNDGPGGDVMLPVEIDFSRPIPASAEQNWEHEYLDSVTEECLFQPRQEEEGRKLLAVAHSPQRPVKQLDDDWMYDPFYDSERLEVAGERF